MPKQSAEYMRAYRARNPTKYASTQAASRARGRAVRRLAATYPDELLAFLNEERAREGLPPLGALKPGPKKAAA